MSWMQGKKHLKKQINSIVPHGKNGIKWNHRRQIYFISNTEYCEDDFKGLKNEISKNAEEMEYFAENLPTRWIQLECALSYLKDSNINILSLKKVADLARQNDLIQKEEELFVFLHYQHQIGNIIFFKDISDYIILQPNWLVKCFRCLVCDNRNYDERLCPTENKTLHSTGKLSENLIVKLFNKEEPTLEYLKYKDHLLKVMEKFDIIIKPTLNIKSEDKYQKSYYIPCMISQKSNLDDIKKTFGVTEPICSLSPWLVLEFDFLPFAYFNHIMFNYIANYTVCKDCSGEPAIYCGKAVFWLENEKPSKLIICFSQNAISLQIWKWGHVSDNVYTDIIDDLYKKVEQLIKDFGQNISYKKKAKCSSGHYADARGRISLNQYDKAPYLCDEASKMHNTDDIRAPWFKPSIAYEHSRDSNKTREQLSFKSQKKMKAHDSDITLPEASSSKYLKDNSKCAGQISGKIIEDLKENKETVNICTMTFDVRID
ncbi:unnamed protein product [Mytilus edulis]|uniref:COR domain-containing protein n=1 Tax=Mytilus edulis TaxID=6550 RepID=A0A8S3VJZ3_MYTED|nr:unnamed protein product [Mytilus edulis]